MPREVPNLSNEQRVQIAETLRPWAESHPYPDSPLIQLADGSELSPRDMARAVAEPDSQKGSLLYRVFAAGTIEDDVERPESLEEILAPFQRDTEVWQREKPERPR